MRLRDEPYSPTTVVNDTILTEMETLSVMRTASRRDIRNTLRNSSTQAARETHRANFTLAIQNMKSQTSWDQRYSGHWRPAQRTKQRELMALQQKLSWHVGKQEPFGWPQYSRNRGQRGKSQKTGSYTGKRRAARKTATHTRVHPSWATPARCTQRSLNSVHGTRWNLYWVRHRWASEKDDGALTPSSLSDNWVKRTEPCVRGPIKGLQQGKQKQVVENVRRVQH